MARVTSDGVGPGFLLSVSVRRMPFITPRRASRAPVAARRKLFRRLAGKVRLAYRSLHLCEAATRAPDACEAADPGFDQRAEIIAPQGPLLLKIGSDAFQVFIGQICLKQKGSDIIRKNPVASGLGLRLATPTCARCTLHPKGYRVTVAITCIGMAVGSRTKTTRVAPRRHSRCALDTRCSRWA